jgi:hypothetical protein
MSHHDVQPLPRSQATAGGFTQVPSQPDLSLAQIAKNLMASDAEHVVQNLSHRLAPLAALNNNASDRHSSLALMQLATLK